MDENVKKRVETLLSQMNIYQKAAILGGSGQWQSYGFDSLGISPILLSDGPSGVRRQEGEGDHLGLNESVKATCFPSAATMANSWDEEMGEELGSAIGNEAFALGLNVLLGPGLNIKRSPLCGRNFEYFSEDPYLSGKMAASYIRGIQSQGVYACPKHFAVNSQEERRMSMDSVVDERTLREIYLTAFEIAVKEGDAGCLMTSYNRVNGTYANENRHLLLDILREEWGYEGMVVTDWGGSNDHVEGVRARSNLEMPVAGLDSAKQIIDAVNSGKMTEEELDICVADFLAAVITLTNNKEKYPGFYEKNFDRDAHHACAKKAALKSAVLLKNEGKILPLKAGIKVGIIGDFAFTPRYQGAGSSLVNSTKVESISELAKEYKEIEIAGIVPGYMRDGSASLQREEEALALAEKCDVILYCMGLNESSESEGLDRKHLEIPANQVELLKKLQSKNSEIVGVISGGAAIEMPWDCHLKAVLHGYLNGQAGAGAVLDLLTGRGNPEGKLSETFPVKHQDTPAYNYYPAKEKTGEYREGLFVGYRYYDTAGVDVKYPFGFGLSYTTFEYSGIVVNDDGSGISFTVKNTGEMAGAEVSQLYVKKPNSFVFRPEKELRGFAKTYLNPGEEKIVSISFDDKTFRFFDVKTNRFEEEPGEYEIMVGASSRDIRLQTKITREGTVKEAPYDLSKLTSYVSGHIENVTDEEYELILGRKIPEVKWSGELEINDAFCQLYYSKSAIGRFIYKRLKGMMDKAEKAGTPDLNTLFIYNMPFRAVAKMTGGSFSLYMAEGLTDIFNKHLFKGLKKVVVGFFRNRKINKEIRKHL